MQDAVLVVASDGGIGGERLFVNKAYVRLFGLRSEEEAKKLSIEDVILPEDMHLITERRNARIQGKPTSDIYSYRMRRASDGELRVVEATSVSIDWEGRPATFALIRDVTEKSKAQKVHAYNSAIIDSLAESVIGTDQNGIITSWNNGAVNNYGYTAKEAIGKHISMIDPPNLPSEVPQIIQKMLKGEIIHQLETVRMRKDGSTFDVSVTLAPVFDEAGKLITIASISRDISERKRSERRMAQMAAIVESSRDAIYAVDLDRKIINWNHGAEIMYGYSSDEAIGERIDMIVPHDRADEPSQIMAKVMNGIRVDQFETIRQKKDGSRINVSLTISPVFNPDGKITSIASISQDVSERKRSEEQISHLATIVESSNDAIFSTTLDGVILNWNPGAEHMYGYTAKEIIGKSISILLAQNRKGHIPGVLQRLDQGERSPGMESTHLTKDGRKIRISYTVSPIKDKTGKAVAIAVINRDISDMVALEAQFRQAQKMEAIGRLAGGVAHDFNNLLTPILGFSEIGFQEMESTSPMRTYFEEISKAAESARNVTRQLLYFSQKQLLDTVVFNANSLISDMSTLIRRLVGEDIQVNVNLNADPWLIKADKTEIQQVLMNLIVNCRDAMPKGGTILLETSNFTVDAAYSTMHPDVSKGEYFFISVKDTGTGMTEDVKMHLFEPFFTTKEKGKGTGLGLATSYAIIDQSKGHIVVDSELNKGTTIQILLPRTKEPAAQAKPVIDSPSLENLTRGYERVLLVEDNDAVRQVTNQMLTRLGYAVTQAANGSEALEIAKTEHSNFELVLTDVIMPGMNGKQLADEIRRIYPETKVMFMSGYVDEPILQDGLSGPLIRKPFTLSVLASKMREILEQKPNAK